MRNLQEFEELGVQTILSKIIKRNGHAEDFDSKKITRAILKAAQATGEFDERFAKLLTIRVLNLAQQFASDGFLTVEEIQDIVEEILLSSPYKKTAKAYILYRDQHAKMREIASKFNLDIVDQYLSRLDWKVNENSNMSFSLQGLNNYISAETSKLYWLNKIYPAQIKQAHLRGDFHIHDLGLLSVYCVGWDLQDLLWEGFQGAPRKIESSPAKHLRSALGQIINFFYTLQGEAAGAQAFSNFDTLLAPFIRYDNLNYKEVKQALQEFVFNVNIPTRVGFQTPFTNVTLDLTVPSYYAKQGVIIGGKVQDALYKDFTKEMDMFNQAFLEVLLEGDAKGRGFTFPIPTYNISEDFDWNNPNLENLWKVTAKYGSPYFANFVNSSMKPEDARSMCCRLRIDNRELKKRSGSLFGSSPLTGSIGVVTINLPRLGYLSKDKDEFFQRLEKLLISAKESLEIKRKILERFTEQNLYPYMNFYLRSIKQRYKRYWENHFSTVGILGMNEACMNLLSQNIASKGGKEFAEQVLDFILENLQSFQEETGNKYNLEATPAEGTSYRLAKLDKQRYPDILFASKEAKNPFYTNSTHLPVNYTEDVFEVLEHQDSLQNKYTGGTVIHIYVGEKIESGKIIKQLAQKICHNYKLPYFTITPTFSICKDCGYIPGEVPECPKCNQKCEIYSRIVGYLRPIDHWNQGKKEEFQLRQEFKI